MKVDLQNGLKPLRSNYFVENNMLRILEKLKGKRDVIKEVILTMTGNLSFSY
jgi:hypothetical protein